MTDRPCVSRRRRGAAVALAASLLLAPAPAAALAPAIALMIKQMVQQSVTSMVKDTLLGSLRGMGCKGIALSNAIGALDARGGGLGALGMPAGLAGMQAMPPGAAAQLEQTLRSMQPGMALDPAQAAMAQRMMSTLGAPASPAQTLATIDEMAEIGLLPKPVQAEMKECMVLLPQAAPALGMGMGMLAPMLPQLRQAREQLHALSPDEQDEVAATMAGELQAVSAEDRKLMLDSLDGGFFPPRVAAGVRARLAK